MSDDYDKTGAVTVSRVTREFEEAVNAVIPDEPVAGYRQNLTQLFTVLWDNEEQRPHRIHQKTIGLLTAVGETLEPEDDA